jgi:hypothetical protein
LQVTHAYGFDTLTNFDGTGITIAIIVAFNDANIASDLQTFDQAAHLPAANLTVVNQTGGTQLPASDPTGQWQAETSLDVEWVHATAPGANILLVEANSDNLYSNHQVGDLVLAADFARHQPNVAVVSMSFGQNENDISSQQLGLGTAELQLDPYFTTPTGHSGVTFVAGSGDTGSAGNQAPNYPSVSPNVVAVGGTSIPLDAFGNYPALAPTASPYYGVETGWGGSGGGQSTVESKPAYQNSVQQTSMRQVPDVAYLGDPGTTAAQIGVQIYDSTSFTSGSHTFVGFYNIGGTSAGVPQWAGFIARADQALPTPLDGPSQTLPLLYQRAPIDFHDIFSGNNGNFNAIGGYDLVTGRGALNADLLYDLANPSISQNQRFVAHLYLDLYDRAPDSGGLNYWTGVLNNGSMTRLQVATQFNQQSEYYTDLVNYYYQRYLDRSVDSAALAFWVPQLLLGGKSNEFVQAGILGSTEYLQKTGNSNQLFLNYLWRDLLNREIDPQANSYFLGLLSSGTSTYQVSQQILASTEYRTDLVNTYYIGMYHRQGDSGGLNYFAGQLNGGATDEAVLEFMLAQNEFFNR